MPTQQTPRPLIGKAIRLSGLTVEAAAGKLGVTPKTLYAWQRGAGGRTGASISKMRELAALLGCEPSEIIPDIFEAPVAQP